ncbi:MAG: tRNA epoxyqueuosine(34) reductase QueG [Phycisphaerae bacterium]|nr:tRNA epoxyqueuosine(34) reductase QueG [Phycisphaerae bacterium]
MAASLAESIVERCLLAGFAAAGVAPAAASKWGEAMRAWLAAGSHGAMEYMSRDLEVRLDPRRVLDGTRAFLVVADLYASRAGTLASNAPESGTSARGRIARYAQGRNYHDVMKRRLHALADALRIEHPGSEFRTCVDTAPILERELAVAAGIGWQAKNTMVIHPRLGSYVLLGVVATTLPLTTPAEQWTATDHCGTCTRCIEACPTGAITPYRVEASRCVSYLTIEHRDVIPVELHGEMGDWIYGCDVCQEVCPHNSPRDDGGVPYPAYSPRAAGLDLLDVLNWDRAAREQAFRTSPMKRAGLAVMKRNALIVAGNVLRDRSDAALLARVKAVAGDNSEPDVVRRTAREILQQLDDRS